MYVSGRWLTGFFELPFEHAKRCVLACIVYYDVAYMSTIQSHEDYVFVIDDVNDNDDVKKDDDDACIMMVYCIFIMLLCREMPLADTEKSRDNSPQEHEHLGASSTRSASPHSRPSDSHKAVQQQVIDSFLLHRDGGYTNWKFQKQNILSRNLTYYRYLFPFNFIFLQQ